MEDDSQNPKQIRQDIPCITLTVKVVSEFGIGVPDCKAQFSIHDQAGDSPWWKLDGNGVTSQKIHGTKVPCNVRVRGKDFDTLYHSESGINVDTDVVFVLQKCGS